MIKKIVSVQKIKIIVVSICVLIVLVLVFSDYGIIKRTSLEIQSNEFEKEILLQEQITDSLQITINKLKRDTFEIEKIAREKYGMSKKDEETYYFKQKKN